MTSSAPAPRAGWTTPWWLLLASCALLLTLVDAILLQLNDHYFSGGFKAPNALDSGLLVFQFIAAGLVIDVLVVLLAWTISLPLLRRLPISTPQKWVAAGMLGVVVPLSYTFLRYELRRYLGDLDFELMRTLAGGWTLEMLAQGSSHLIPFGATLLGAMCAGIAVVWLFRRVRSGEPETRMSFELPTGRSLLLPLALCLLFSFVALPGYCVSGSRVCRGLLVKPGGAAVSIAVQQLSDVDRDGAGLLSMPPDPAPFDGSVHAYALEVPGNGLDENGIAGDLPVDFVEPQPAAELAPRWTRRPHVLLIFGESLRADVLERSYEGRRIMPFLSRLGAEGASSQHGYTNVPYTSKARAQLFGGRLDPYNGQTSLVDDFKHNDYFVAHFSGQDDSFGGRGGQLGVALPDRLYDARQDSDLRVSRFTSAGSLAVSWKLLNRRISEFLDTHELDQPLFLYVNYHDTHFPYAHREMDRILDVDPLPRHRIKPETREQLWATYANAAANVDRGVEQLVARFRQAIGDDEHAILFTADHGQSLFDFGYLGHGQALNEEQTRVPMVIWGIGGDWPEPLGVSDLRGLIQRNLSVPGRGQQPPQPRLVQPAGQRIFQYMSLLSRPRLLAFREYDRALHYAFHRGELSLEGRNGGLSPLEIDAERAGFETLIRTWEALDLREARLHGRE